MGRPSSRQATGVMAKRTALAAIVAIASSTVIPACNGEQLDGGTRHTFFVRSALAPPDARTGSGSACVYQADSMAPSLFEGVFDVGLSDSYQLTLLLQASDGADATSVTAAHVVVRQGDEVINEFDAVTTAYLDRAGFAVLNVTGVDPRAKEKLVPILENRSVQITLVAEVALTGGSPTGGSTASSPAF